MKHMWVMVFGMACGAFVTHYIDSASFAAKVRQHADSAVSSAAATAHESLTSK